MSVRKGSIVSRSVGLRIVRLCLNIEGEVQDALHINGMPSLAARQHSWHRQTDLECLWVLGYE